jgi:hypothetical protein
MQKTGYYIFVCMVGWVLCLCDRLNCDLIISDPCNPITCRQRSNQSSFPQTLPARGMTSWQSQAASGKSGTACQKSFALWNWSLDVAGAKHSIFPHTSLPRRQEPINVSNKNSTESASHPWCLHPTQPAFARKIPWTQFCGKESSCLGKCPTLGA